MRWELRSAAERLPAHRMLVIHSPANQDAVEAVIASCADVLSCSPHRLAEPRERDDVYIWSSHRDFDQAFAERLHQALAALVEEPRTDHHRTAVGVWPYPRRTA
jgi:hypothetical protein